MLTRWDLEVSRSLELTLDRILFVRLVAFHSLSINYNGLYVQSSKSSEAIWISFVPIPAVIFLALNVITCPAIHPIVPATIPEIPIISETLVQYILNNQHNTSRTTRAYCPPPRLS